MSTAPAPAAAEEVKLPLPTDDPTRWAAIVKALTAARSAATPLQDTAALTKLFTALHRATPDTPHTIATADTPTDS
jgi:hypothetical protein